MAKFGPGRRIPGLVLLFCLLATVPVVAIAQGGILSVKVAGDGVITEDNGTAYVWRGVSYNVTVRFEAYSGQDDYIICLDQYVDESQCDPKRERSNMRAGERATVHFTTTPEEVERKRVRIRLHGDHFGPTNPKRDEVTVPVHVIRKRDDVDNDGLSNGDEARNGFAVTDSDTDDDGLADGDEVHRHRTDPAEADSDGDGIPDGTEVAQHSTNPNNVDTDGDGLPDGDELNRYDTDPTVADSDGDGLTDPEEINTYDTAEIESDTDGDGLADGVEVHRHSTDPTGADTDGDGYSDSEEIDTFDTDPTDAASHPQEDHRSSPATGSLTPTPHQEQPFVGIDAVVVGVIGLLVGTVVAIGFLRLP